MSKTGFLVSIFALSMLFFGVIGSPNQDALKSIPSPWNQDLIEKGDRIWVNRGIADHPDVIWINGKDSIASSNRIRLFKHQLQSERLDRHRQALILHYEVVLVDKLGHPLLAGNYTLDSDGIYRLHPHDKIVKRSNLFLVARTAAAANPLAINLPGDWAFGADFDYWSYGIALDGKAIFGSQPEDGELH